MLAMWAVWRDTEVEIWLLSSEEAKNLNWKTRQAPVCTIKTHNIKFKVNFLAEVTDVL